MDVRVGSWRRLSTKNWCFQVVVLEKILESPLDSKEIKSVNAKGNQLWIFIGRIVAEAEVSIFWSPDVMCQLIGKDPDAGKDWRPNEKGWHEQLNWTEWECTVEHMELYLMLCADLNGKKPREEGIYIYIYIYIHTHTHIWMAGSLCHTIETNTTL